MPRKFNPVSVRRTLQNRDYIKYLSSQERGIEKLREKYLVVLVAGTKGSGKSKLADGLYSGLASRGYSVLSTRASEHSDGIYRDNRRKLLKRQESGSGRIGWVNVVNAIRTEASSAIQNKVIPFMRTNNERGVIIMSRYPPVDTLARQHLMDAPLEGVAQRLRGAENEESGYINPDLVFILTRGGDQTRQVLVHREGTTRTERGVELGPDFAEKIDEQIDAYRKITGIN